MLDWGNMRDRFESGLTFQEMLSTVRKNEELWTAVYDRATVPDSLVEAVESLGGPWHLLALSEDWCGDAVNLLPVLERLAERAGNLDLRILSRDDNPDLMDAYLTGGTSRSIPVVILLDGDFEEQDWWGPRPSPLQHWVRGEGLSLESPERYRHIRRYYARDKGRTFLTEIVDMIAGAYDGQAVTSR
ncbi:MAG: thioredoxin family protein [Gemmatimonadetes bacterium]|nr:thioredoxin family protein [Gemmatimonadota bacterium]